MSIISFNNKFHQSMEVIVQFQRTVGHDFVIRLTLNNSIYFSVVEWRIRY